MSVTDPGVGVTTKESWAKAIADALNSTTINTIYNENNGVPNLINGSFEVYQGTLNVDATPNNWDVTLLTGGIFNVTGANVTHGSKSAFFQAPGGTGNGGAYIQSTDFLPVSGLAIYGVQFYALCPTAAGVAGQVDLYWFDANGNPMSTPFTTIWTSDTVPGSWTYFSGIAGPPGGTCFCKVRVTGGVVNSTAGQILFDGVQFFKVSPFTNFAKITTPFTVPGGSTQIKLWLWYSGGSTGAFAIINVNPGDVLTLTGFTVLTLTNSRNSVAYTSAGGNMWYTTTTPPPPGSATVAYIEY